MLTAQGDSRNSKTDSKSKEEARGCSWRMIILGLVFLAGAVLLYLYASSNSPVPRKYQTDSNSISNISRTPAEGTTANSQTTPSPALPTLKNIPPRDKATENKNQ